MLNKWLFPLYGRAELIARRSSRARARIFRENEEGGIFINCACMQPRACVYNDSRGSGEAAHSRWRPKSFYDYVEGRKRGYILGIMCMDDVCVGFFINGVRECVSGPGGVH